MGRSSIDVVERQAHINQLHRYVKEGEPLEPEAFKDFLHNPEILEEEIISLNDKIYAAQCRDVREPVHLEPGANLRLDTVKALANKAIGMGMGGDTFHGSLSFGSSGVLNEFSVTASGSHSGRDTIR